MTKPWHFQTLKINKFWKIAKNKGKGINIAVLDTGLTKVSGLGAQTIKRLDTNGEEIPIGDNHPQGHGTMCTSVIASNSRKAPGIAPNANIFNIKVCGADGGIKLSLVKKAFKIAKDNHCDIINCSFVLPDVDDGLKKAVKAARDRNAFVVASAGNTRDISTVFPERIPFAISVAAIEKNRQPYEGAKLGEWIDIAAPGKQILALSKSGRAAKFNGTSAAAPIVSAVLAVILGRARELNKYDEVVAVLLQKLQLTADDVGTSGKDTATGFGLINPVALIKSLQGILGE